MPPPAALMRRPRPGPATKPWNGKATDHGAVAPCSAWCATRWRPGQHRTGCCRLALMEKRNGAHGELKASDIPYKVKKGHKRRKNCHNIHTSKFLYGLPTAFAHSPPGPSFFSILIPYMYFFWGDLLTSCPSKSISPRPQKTKSIAAKMLPLKKLPKETNLLPPLGVVTELCESLFDPPPRGFLLVLLGVMVRGPTDWLKIFEDISRDLQKLSWKRLLVQTFTAFREQGILRNIWIFQREAKRSEKWVPENWVLTSSEHAIAVEGCCSGAHVRLF